MIARWLRRRRLLREAADLEAQATCMDDGFRESAARIAIGDPFYIRAFGRPILQASDYEEYCACGYRGPARGSPYRVNHFDCPRCGEPLSKADRMRKRAKALREEAGR